MIEMILQESPPRLHRKVIRVFLYAMKSVDISVKFDSLNDFIIELSSGDQLQKSK